MKVIIVSLLAGWWTLFGGAGDRSDKEVKMELANCVEVTDARTIKSASKALDQASLSKEGRILKRCTVRGYNHHIVVKDGKSLLLDQGIFSMSVAKRLGETPELKVACVTDVESHSKDCSLAFQRDVDGQCILTAVPTNEYGPRVGEDIAKIDGSCS